MENKIVEIDANYLLEQLANNMQSVLMYDLSNETKDVYENIDENAFYQYALNDLIEYAAKHEIAENNLAAISKHQYCLALHAACDHFLETNFE